MTSLRQSFVCRRRLRPRILLAAAMACAAAGAHAQAAGDQASLAAAPAAAPAPVPEPAPAPAPERGSVEVGVGAARLSNGLQNWNDLYALGHYNLRPGTTLHWSIARQQHFGETGMVGGLTLVHDFSPDWYGLVGASSASASFQNRYRIDVGAYRKWGAERRWVTGLALMHAASGDQIHHDNAVRLNLMYYAPENWVGEVGLSGNRSNPGSVWSTRGFISGTWGQVGQHTLLVRLEHGQEGYLPVAAGVTFPTDVQFRSTEATLQWRQWIDRRWGYVLGAQFYRNPYYHRAGVQVGLFMDF